MNKKNAENCQTVSLVPSVSSPSYPLVVQDENKPSVKLDKKGKNAPKEQQLKKKGTSFTCDFCTYSTHRRFLVLRHLIKHSNDRPHKCAVCERDFKTAEGLQNHMKTHNGVKSKVCKYCNKRYTTNGELNRHIRYIHTKEKPHKCTQCDYAAVELAKLRRHILSHTGEKPYQCEHCTYASPDSFKLKRHMRTHTKKPYMCNICSLCFTRLKSLDAHRLKHVFEKQVYQCDLCSVKYSRKTDLRTHIQKLHSSDKPHKCQQCGKSFPDRYSCKVHNKTHQGSLKTHLKHTDEKSFSCYLCDQSFKQKLLLRSHLDLYHNLRDKESFKCQFCPYTSATSHHLKAHLRLHTDEKPFPCDLCDQSFRQKRLLRHHHDLYHNPDYVPNEKALLCNICDQTFKHKGHLFRHLAKHVSKTSPREQALTHKQEREKKVIAAETFKNIKPNATESACLVKMFAEEDYIEKENIILSEVNKLMPVERSLRLEEVETCFGLEKQNEEEKEEVFGSELVFQSL